MTGPPDPAPPHLRLQEGWIATLLLLAAAAGLLLITRTDVVRFSPQTNLYVITAGLFALAAPGPIVRLWDLPAQLFFWNAIGWGSGLVLFGMASVGALPVLALILGLLALSFWPHEPESTAPWQAITIVLLGGLLVCRLAWGEVVWDIPFGTGEWW